MKLKIKNRLTERAGRRFKWMSMATVCIFTLQYLFSGTLTSLQEFAFVEAGEDQTFEQDEVYMGYIKSA